MTLTGFDVPACLPVGQSMTATLVWQAVGETDQDYKAFVHLFAPDGQLDAHTLDLGSDLPASEYRLAAGMHVLGSGQRLSASGGADSIDLGSVQLSK